MSAVIVFVLMTVAAWLVVSVLVRVCPEPLGSCVYDTDEYTVCATLQTVVPLTAGIVTAASMYRGETLFGVIFISLFFSFAAYCISGFAAFAVVNIFRGSEWISGLGYSLKDIYEFPEVLYARVKRLLPSSRRTQSAESKAPVTVK